MDPLLETLEGAVQRLRLPPPVAVEVEKIREQLAEHRAQGLELDKLLPSFSALCARGEELIGRAAHDDPAAQGERPGRFCLITTEPRRLGSTETVKSNKSQLILLLLQLFGRASSASALCGTRSGSGPRTGRAS